MLFPAYQYLNFSTTNNTEKNVHINQTWRHPQEKSYEFEVATLFYGMMLSDSLLCVWELCHWHFSRQLAVSIAILCVSVKKSWLCQGRCRGGADTGRPTPTLIPPRLDPQWPQLGMNDWGQAGKTPNTVTVGLIQLLLKHSSVVSVTDRTGGSAMLWACVQLLLSLMPEYKATSSRDKPLWCLLSLQDPDGTWHTAGLNKYFMCITCMLRAWMTVVRL